MRGLGGRYLRLWSASTISALGSGLALIATPLLIASRTRDPLLVSLATAVSWLPWLLFALPGGVLADRVDRRRLMVLIDWVRVVALAVLATAILTGRASVPLLYGVLFLVNAGEAVFRSAAQAMIPAVVPRAKLERANGLLSGGTTLVQGIIAAPIAGVLFGIAAGLPFVVNAGTYAASAVLVMSVAGTYRPAPDAPARRSMRAEMLEGFRWLVRQRVLCTMSLLIGLLNLTLTAAESVLVLLARERLHLGALGYSLLLTCLAVGGILGAAVGDRLIALVSGAWTMRLGLLVETGTHLVLATARSAFAVGAALFAFGVHGALWGIVGASLRQRLTPPGMLGRVTATTLFVAVGGNCLGAVLGGVLAGRLGLSAPYWVGFLVAVVVTAATWPVLSPGALARAYAEAPEEAPTGTAR